MGRGGETRRKEGHGEAGRDRFGPGIYVHVPFCVSRCGYCDFFTAVGPPAARRAFVRDLRHEIDLAAAGGPFASASFASGSFASGRLVSGSLETGPPSPPGPAPAGDDPLSVPGNAFRTVFFGGGTPSLLPGPVLGAILESLRARFLLDPDCEITVECNPESLTPRRLAAYRRAGVNRISLGVQSLDDEELRLLDRPHDAALVRRTVRRIRRAGFENLNIDLIYGLPGRTLRSWDRTLARALRLEPDHLSAYLLALEPRVPLARRLARRGEALPGDDAVRAQYELLTRRAEAAGLRSYEISNFALPGRECRHNLNYWVRGDYLGLGPSAHSHRSGLRWANVASMARYRGAVRAGERPVQSEERVGPRDAAAEWIFLGLRLSQGVSWPVLARAAGREGAERLAAAVDRLVGSGLLHRAGEHAEERVLLAPEARFVSNAVFVELMEALDAEGDVGKRPSAAAAGSGTESDEGCAGP